MLASLLSEVSAVDGLISCGLFDHDGLLLSSTGSSADVETWATQIARMEDSSREMANDLEIGKFECITVLGSEGTCICWELPPRGRLVVVLSKHTNLGEIRRTVRERLERISSLL